VITEVTPSGRILTSARFYDLDLQNKMRDLDHLVSFFELNTKPALEVTNVSVFPPILLFLVFVS
jgi:hypothetical protein